MNLFICVLYGYFYLLFDFLFLFLFYKREHFLHQVIGKKRANIAIRALKLMIRASLTSKSHILQFSTLFFYFSINVWVIWLFC